MPHHPFFSLTTTLSVVPLYDLTVVVVVVVFCFRGTGMQIYVM